MGLHFFGAAPVGAAMDSAGTRYMTGMAEPGRADAGGHLLRSERDAAAIKINMPKPGWHAQMRMDGGTRPQGRALNSGAHA